MMQQASELADKATELAQENLSKAGSAAALHKEGLAGTSDASPAKGERGKPEAG